MKSFDLIIYAREKVCGYHEALSVCGMHRYKSLAKQMAGRGKVLVVSHYASVIPDFFSGSSLFFRKLKSHTPAQIEDNLFSFTPLVPLKLGAISKIPFLLKMARYHLAKQITSVLSNLDFNSPYRVTMASHPFHWAVVGLVGEDLKIYECRDDYSTLGPGQKIGSLFEDEIKMLRLADLSFATAKFLFNNIKKYNSKVCYLPNAVDSGLFFESLDRRGIPSDLMDIPLPRIGFMGELNHWYDLDLLHEVMFRNRDWNFVFVGAINPQGIEEQVKLIQVLPNSYFLGWKHYRELPSYLKGFAVAVMPYKTGRLTQSINPGKVYQYMAVGLPIVSTPIPEVMEYSKVIEIASSPAGFIKAIEKCLADKSQEKRNLLKAIAAENTWDKRAEREISLIEKELSGKEKIL